MARIEKTINLNVDTSDGQKNVEGLNKTIEQTGSAAQGAKKGTRSLTAGFKGMGLALKAIGIGLIIEAFIQLKNIFSGNIETARKFEKIGAKLSAMFDVVRDAAEPVFELLIEGFENPQQAIRDFWTALKQNVVNRVEGLIDTFGALGRMITAVFNRDLKALKEAASDAGTAFIQLNTGLDETQQTNFVEKVKEVTKEMKEEGKAAEDLTDTMQGIRDEEREMLLIRAKANKQIAESRLLAEDDTKSNEERLEALKKAVEEEQRVAKLEEDIQKKKVDAMQAMIDLGKSSEEDIQALAEERARLIELQTASTLRQKRVAAEVGVFTAKVEKEGTDLIKARTEAKERGLEITEEMTTKEINALIKASKEKEKLDKKDLQNTIKLQEAKQKAVLGAVDAIAGAIGKDTKAGKTLAVGKAIIDTYVGANKALAQGGILGFAGAAAIIASGFANVKSITSTDVGGGGGGGSAPSEQQGGGIDPSSLIPNMDAILPTDTGEVPPVQAYVVENDISNSQALQEELNIQATL